MIVPGILVCISFLISVCVYCVKSFAHIECYVRAIWLNPFATVLFNVCSAVTVECYVLYPCCVGGFAVM